MELRDYLNVLRAHWIGILVFTVLGIGVAGAYTATQPKVYAANANGLVFVGQSARDPATISVQDSLAKSKAASYVAIATSRAVADKAIADLGLDASAAGLIGDITVTQPEGTAQLRVRATAEKPELAREIADAWVRAIAMRVQEIENPSGKAATDVIRVTPIEAAALPTVPISPLPKRNLGAGALLGVLLGLAYAIVRNRLDRRLRDPSEVERRFGVTTIGQVPLAKAKDETERATTPLGTGLDRRNWSSAEAFRKLRTNLAYMRVDDPPRTIVITSPRPGDGKSTTASNLAVAIALSGQPVVLVDADLRRPTVADTLGLVEGAGLTDLLIGTVKIDDVLQQHPDIEHLAVLAAGSIPPNPSELLSSQSMRNLLQELAVDRIVVIDAPPLLPVTDAAVLTRSSDGAIIVVSYGSTLDTELEGTLHQLSTVQGTVLGLVFNRVPDKGSSYGGYYGEYYSRTSGAQTEQEKKGRAKLRSRKARRAGRRR